MPTLKATGGKTITFKISNIDAIADHNDATGEPKTCVYGVLRSLVMIDEAVLEFMRRLGIEDKFAQFTRPNGWLVWINGASVDSVSPPMPKLYARGTNTVISAGSWTQGVKEKTEQVIAAVNAHGGKL
jgi:hypothetical protein